MSDTRSRMRLSAVPFGPMETAKCDAARGHENEGFGHDLDRTMGRREMKHGFREPYGEPFVRYRKPIGALPSHAREGRQKTFAEQHEGQLVDGYEHDGVERIGSRQAWPSAGKQERQSEHPSSHQRCMKKVDSRSEKCRHAFSPANLDPSITQNLRAWRAQLRDAKIFS